MLLVGTIEDFDEFLVLLSKQINVAGDNMLYQSRNIADDNRVLQLPVEFTERIKEINELDDELYRWVRSELVPEYIEQYGNGFGDDVANFKRMLKGMDSGQSSSLPGDFFRTAYVKPVTGFIRLCNGMPYSGADTDGPDPESSEM